MPTVAIVGMGPRGLYCLEALITEFSVEPLSSGLQVAIFNNSGRFGVSPIYDPDQPSYLLSNIRVKELDLWADDGFARWYDQRFRPAKPLDPEAYPPRAMVGRYLQHGFRRAMSRVPPGMRMLRYVAEVTDIVPGKTGYHLKFTESDGGSNELVAHKIMLSTGHSFVRPGGRERQYQRFAARRPRTSFLPHAYPVSATMSGVPAGTCVAMKGIGLTFVDAVLALTEGRGGVFEREAGGRLRYLMSGQEPKMIMPYGRTGLPMVPKSHDFPSTPRPLTFVTAAKLTELRRRRGKLDLEQDIWPLAELDMELRYYQTAMGDRRELDECGADANVMRRVIDKFLTAHPDVPAFGYGHILDPVGDRGGPTAAEHHLFVESYLRQEIDHARAGLASSPARAAVSMWYEIRAALKPFVAYGGLTAYSHRRLIEYYFPLFKRVVFGPPLISMEKILALHGAGILDFSVARNPRVTARDSIGCFELRTSGPAGTSAQAEVLVDARYPTVEIVNDVSPLFQNLRRRGMIKEFVNNSAGSTYAPGAIDMSNDSHSVIDHRGAPNADISVYGPPTEGNLIGTFVISRDGFARTWAANILGQLRVGS
jgi:hypothetical protein